MQMTEENDNLLDNVGSHKNVKPVSRVSNIENNNIDLVNKSSNITSHIRDVLWECIAEKEILGSELSLSLGNV